MNKYLLIENHGISDLDTWLLLGVSTTRDQNNQKLIGKFGSGTKHAIITFLKNKISPIIYFGTKEIEFFSKSEKISLIDGQSLFDVVYCKNGDTVEKTGFTLQFGELDWTKLDMAIREVVSNAIDCSIKLFGDMSGCRIEIVNEILPQEGKTQVYLPLTREIEQYHRDLGRYFLHFSFEELELEKSSVIDKSELDIACVYRRGVLIGHLDNFTKSLFDYNFADVYLDESRNLNEYAAKNNISQLMPLLQEHQIERLFNSFGDEKVLEHEISLYYACDKSHKVVCNWAKIWKKKFDENAVAVSRPSPFVLEKLKQNNKIPIFVPSVWKELLGKWGIKTDIDFVFDDADGLESVEDAPEYIVKLAHSIWKKLFLKYRFNPKKKRFPSVFLFQEISGRITKFGFCNDKGIFLNSRFLTNNSIQSVDVKNTIIEELFHWATGASDFSQTMQSGLIELLTRTVTLKSEWSLANGQED